MSPSFSISKAEVVSVLKGAGIAAGGAVLTYLSSYFSGHDFGVYTPVVMALWSVVVNFCRKFFPSTQNGPLPQ